MKKLIALLLALVMVACTALADCSCITDDVRLALFDLIGVDGLQTTDEQHDIIVQAYLGMVPECEELKENLIGVIGTNYSVITSGMSAEKYKVIIDYISSCHCMDSQQAEPEETAAPKTVTATPTPKPAARATAKATKKPTAAKKTAKPTAKPKATAKPHTHTGGTHENGGRCTGCGQVYQTHKITVKKLNATYHQQVCSCGYTKKVKHTLAYKYVNVNYHRMTCSVCGYTGTHAHSWKTLWTYKGSERLRCTVCGKQRTKSSGCSCGCKGGTCKCCSGCKCKKGSCK